MNRIINLYSDTQTRPSKGMRQAIADAEVGDEQLGEDPSVRQLCERVADMLGYEAALFAPSGTMCNQIAVLTHCLAGDEVICEASSHLVNTEGAGAAALAGVATRTLTTERGVFTGEDVREAARGATRTGPRSRLVVVEQTANFHGGRVWPLGSMRDVAATASAVGLASHVDGARLLNAAIAANISAREFCGGSGFDSAWLAMSKGLGCPVGGVLCGTKPFIEEAWRWKYRMGGAMRQAGILAAAGIYALNHNVARLADDHSRAQKFAAGLAQISPGLVDLSQVETNIVILDTTKLGTEARDFAYACASRGLKLSAIGRTRLRAITHLDIGDQDIADALNIVGDIVNAGRIAPAPAVTGAGHLYG